MLLIKGRQIIILLMMLMYAQAFASMRQVAVVTIATNPQILEAANQLKANHYLKWQTIGQFFPKADLFISRGEEQTQFDEDEPFVLFPQETNIVIQQPIFQGFRLVGNYHNAKYNEKAQFYQYLETRRQVLLAAVEAYINILKDRRLVQLAKNNIGIHITTLYQVDRRYKAGVGNRTEVALAKSRLALARSQYIKLVGVYKQDRIAFYTITGFYPKDNISLPQLPKHKLPSNLDEALGIGLRRSFEIQLARALIRANKAEITVSKSNFYPQVSANFAKEKERDLDGIEQTERNLRAEVNINFNLFNGTSDYAAVKAAEHIYYSSIDNAIQIQRQVHNNISQSWVAMKINKKDEIVLTKYVKYAARVTHDYRIQFTVGKRALFNVLDSEQELFNARIALATAAFNYKLNFYRLFAAMSQLLPIVMQTH